MKTSKLILFTNSFINVIFYIGIAVCILVPWAIQYAGQYMTIFAEHYWGMVIVFLLSGIFAEMIFLELKRIFRTVVAKDPFVMSNVTALKRMGYYAFAIAAISVVRLSMSVTPAILVVILVFVIAGLFSLVLSQVFMQAVNYKTENDLTI